LIVCKDNVSNFCKYFLKKKPQNFFLQKTVDQGHLAEKFFIFQKIIFLENDAPFFLHQKLFNSTEYLNFYESY